LREGEDYFGGRPAVKTFRRPRLKSLCKPLIALFMGNVSTFSGKRWVIAGFQGH